MLFQEPEIPAARCQTGMGFRVCPGRIARLCQNSGGSGQVAFVKEQLKLRGSGLFLIGEKVRVF